MHTMFHIDNLMKEIKNYDIESVDSYLSILENFKKQHINSLDVIQLEIENYNLIKRKLLVLDTFNKLNEVTKAKYLIFIRLIINISVYGCIITIIHANLDNKLLILLFFKFFHKKNSIN